jgi:hypothetical protein
MSQHAARRTTHYTQRGGNAETRVLGQFESPQERNSGNWHAECGARCKKWLRLKPVQLRLRSLRAHRFRKVKITVRAWTKTRNLLTDDAGIFRWPHALELAKKVLCIAHPPRLRQRCCGLPAPLELPTPEDLKHCRIVLYRSSYPLRSSKSEVPVLSLSKSQTEFSYSSSFG